MQRKTFTRTLLAACALAAALPLAAQAQATSSSRWATGPRRATHATKRPSSSPTCSRPKRRPHRGAGRPSAQLGDDAAMVTAVRTGALDMTANSQGAVPTLCRSTRLWHALPVLHARAGFQAAGWPAGQGAGTEVGRQGHGRAGLLGQRHPPDDQQQAPDHQGRGHEGPEDAHAARRGAGGHHAGAGRRGAADQVRRAVRRAAAGRGGRPGEPAGQHLTPASFTRCKSTWR
jgi:hypothetical protein